MPRFVKQINTSIESRRHATTPLWKKAVAAKDALRKSIAPLERYMRPHCPAPLDQNGNLVFFNPTTGRYEDLGRRLSPRQRTAGVSGFMRVKNEEEFIGRAIDSVLPGLDELVIVYNDCTDRTPEIIREYQQHYPKQIRVFQYAPTVFPQGSAEYRSCTPSSPHSLVNYYNFALAMTTTRYAIKIDGDDIFVPTIFRALCDHIRYQGCADTFLNVRGINLWDHNGTIYVNGSSPLMGLGDRGFFAVNNTTFHVKHPQFERMPTTHLRFETVGPIFFHTKGLKKDRGIGVFQLEDNPHSYAHTLVHDCYENPSLLAWNYFARRFYIDSSVPDPNTLFTPHH